MSLEAMQNIFTKNWPFFLRGAGITLWVSIIGTIIGSIIGLLVGVIRTTPVPESGGKRVAIKAIDRLLAMYIGFFRGTPMMVQAMVIFYGIASQFGVEINRIYAAIFIVSINTGAYMAEIVRGGINSVDKGQFEAAHAIGMNHITTMKEIVLPQVIRNILPATGNEFVVNIKDTSMLSVIGVTELFFQTRSIAGSTFIFYEPFLITSLIYLIMTLSVTKILRMIEDKLAGKKNYDVVEELVE